jgi:hypothetical protein
MVKVAYADNICNQIIPSETHKYRIDRLASAVRVCKFNEVASQIWYHIDLFRGTLFPVLESDLGLFVALVQINRCNVAACQ